MRKKLYVGLLLLTVLQSCSSINAVIESNGFYTNVYRGIRGILMPYENISRRGKWSEKDRKAFTKGCEDEINKLKDTPNGKTIQGAGVNIEEFAQKACDCAMKKVEQKYQDPKEANKDNEGLTNIGSDCGRDVMIELMKK
ncbi:hypothetical protein AD998_16385 [bacterium 336/3]|nr:hypothetical protein AD998_16385 [bacterium 336/3]